MAREKQPDEDQIPLLEALSQAAVLRSEAYRLYLSLFQQALTDGVGPSVIARYAFISPQAANSTKHRLRRGEADDDAPTSVDHVFERVTGRRPRRRRNAS